MLAENLLTLMARPVDIPGQRLSVQGSIGVTTTSRPRGRRARTAV